MEKIREQIIAISLDELTSDGVITALRVSLATKFFE